MEEIATVYARSLFEAASESGRRDEIREQLAALADALDANRDMQVFFFSPYFSTAEKEAGLARAVTEADPLVSNFVALLIENHRMPVLFRIRRRFDALCDEQDRRLPVAVTSAIALDQRTLDQIGERIGEQTGRHVELTSAVDPEILGGIVLRVGNSILDASIRGRLEQLRTQVARG